MAKRRRRAPAGTVEVDFTNVKEGGGTRVPEDDYRVKVKSVKQETAQSGNQMLVFMFEITEGKHKGKEIRDNCVLTTKSLWRLRDLLEAMGMTVPKKVVHIPIRKLSGRELGVTLVDGEPYNGRIKSEVADYLDLDTLNEEDEDEEDEDDELDEDEETEDELDGMDRSELKAYIKENDLDVSVKKSMSDEDLREAIREEEGDEEDEDDEEEEEETPPKRSRSKKGKKKSKDDDEEIDELDLDDL